MATEKVRALSWKPLRRGPIYCAPACGFRCTWAAHEAAKRRAQELSIRLGKGWRPHVWENMGWYYEAISPCGRLKVSPSVHRGRVLHYTAFLGPASSPGGRWAEHGGTAEEAIRNVVRVGVEDLRELGAYFRDLPQAPKRARLAAILLSPTGSWEDK